MDENIDPEKMKETNEQLRDLVTELESLNKVLKNDFSKNIDRSTDSIDDNVKASKELTEQQNRQNKEYTRYVESVGKAYGFVKDSEGKWTASYKKEAEIRDAIREELKAKIGEEKFLEEQRRQLYESQLRSLGYELDDKNKLRKVTVDLTREQQALIQKVKLLSEQDGGLSRLSAGANTLEGTISAGVKSLSALAGGGMAGALAFQALEVGIQGFRKVLDASINAQVGYSKSLLNGERGQAVVARRNEEIGKAANAVIRDFGGLAISAGVASVALAFIGGPLTLGLKAITRIISGIFGAASIAAGVYAQRQADANDRVLEFETLIAGLKDKVFDAFNDLSSASLTGAEGMTGVSKMLEKLQMSDAEVAKFSGIVKGAGKELAMLGPSTVGGLKNFVDTAGNLIKSGLGAELETMGINNEKQAAHVLQFMVKQERFGLKQEQDQTKLLEASKKYIVELDKIAALTGATREEQEKAREQVMAIEELRAAIAVTDDAEEKKRLENVAKTAEALFASGQKEAGAAIAKMAASGGAVTDQEQAKLVATMPNFVDQTLKGVSSVADNLTLFSQDLVLAQKQYGDIARFNGEAVKDLLITGYAKGQDFITTIQKAVEAAQKENMELGAYLEKQRKVTDKATEEQVELIRKERKEAVDLQTKAVEKFGSATNSFKEGVKGFKEYVEKMLGLEKKEEVKDTGASEMYGEPAYDPFTGMPIGGEERKPTTRGIKPPPGTAGAPASEASGGTAPGTIDKNEVLKLIKFQGDALGNKSHYDMLNSNVKENFEKMIAEYGKPVQVNAAMRDKEEQQRMYDAATPRGDGKRYNKYGNPVAPPDQSKHTSGKALDLNPADVLALDSLGLLAKYGFKKLEGDPPHIEMAKKGGAFSGPTSGYPVMLHGDEIVIPQPDLMGMIESLSKVKKTELQDLTQASKTPTTPAGLSDNVLQPLVEQQGNMIEILSTKLDAVISKLSTSNDLQQGILTYQQT